MNMNSKKSNDSHSGKKKYSSLYDVFVSNYDEIESKSKKKNNTSFSMHFHPKTLLIVINKSSE